MSIDRVHQGRSFKDRRGFSASDDQGPGSTAPPAKQMEPTYVYHNDDNAGRGQSSPEQWSQRQGAAHGRRKELDTKGQGDRRQEPREMWGVVGLFVAGRDDAKEESTVGVSGAFTGRCPLSGQHDRGVRGDGAGGNYEPTSPPRRGTFNEDRGEGQSGTEGNATGEKLEESGIRTAAAGPPRRAFHAQRQQQQQQQVRGSSEPDQNQRVANTAELGHRGGRWEQDPFITRGDSAPGIKADQVRSRSGDNGGESGGGGSGSDDYGGGECEWDSEPTAWPIPSGVFGPLQNHREQQQQRRQWKENFVKRGYGNVHSGGNASATITPGRRLDVGSHPVGAEFIRPRDEGPVEAATNYLPDTRQATTSHNHRGVRQDQPRTTATGQETQQLDNGVAVATLSPDGRRWEPTDLPPSSVLQEKNHLNPPPPVLSAGRWNDGEGDRAVDGWGNTRVDGSDSVDGRGAYQSVATNVGGGDNSHDRGQETALSSHSRSPSPHRGLGQQQESGYVLCDSKRAESVAVDASIPMVNLSIEDRPVLSPLPNIPRMAAVVDAAASSIQRKNDRGRSAGHRAKEHDRGEGGAAPESAGNTKEEESIVRDREQRKRQEAALRAFLRGVSCR